MVRSHTFALLVVICLATALAATPASAQLFDFFGASSSPYGSEAARKRPVAPPRPKAAAAAVIPDKAPQGILQIVVSIPDQRLKVYAGGELYATAPVSTGKPGHGTPKGVFSILQKRKFHRSNIYSGAPMPNMQRLTWSGIALHAGALPGYPASHGCIRLPHAFSDRLFRITALGARVVVTDGLIAPRPLMHDNLLVYRAPDFFDHVDRLPPLAMPGATVAETLMATLVPPIVPASDQVSTGSDEPTVVDERSEPEDEPSALERGLLKRQPVTVFVSRRTGKVYVRQGYEPLFSADIEIQDRQLPIGTHVLTVMARDPETKALTWNAMTLPTQHARAPRVAEARGRSDAGGIGSATAAEMSATAALERLHWPDELKRLVGPLLMPGSSILISDQGLGRETGKFTDFIVLVN